MRTITKFKLYSQVDYLDFLTSQLFDAAIDQETCIAENGDTEFDQGWLAAFHNALAEAQAQTQGKHPWLSRLPVYTHKGMESRLVKYVHAQLEIANHVRDSHDANDFNEGRAAAWENWAFCAEHGGEVNESGWVSFEPGAALEFLASSPNGTLHVSEVKPALVRAGEEPDAITS